MRFTIIACLLLKVLISQANLDSLPVFMKQGYSTILDFNETPSKIVLGDSGIFQVEKLDKSLVIKALQTYGNTNLIVYFMNDELKIFTLQVSEEYEPTHYRKFDKVSKFTSEKISKESSSSAIPKSRIVKITSDQHKDYLTIDLSLYAGDNGVLKPKWNEIALKNSKTYYKPHSLWSERKSIESKTHSKARLVFRKALITEDSKLIIPIEDSPKSIEMKVDRN